MNWIAQDMHDNKISIVDLNSKSQLAYNNFEFKEKLASQESSQQFVIGGSQTVKSNLRKSRNSIVFEIQNGTYNARLDSKSNKSDD